MLYFEALNSEPLFVAALGLENPWGIEPIRFDKEVKQLDIHIGFTSGHKFKMSDGRELTNMTRKLINGLFSLSNTAI